jgi:hypothetical protein
MGANAERHHFTRGEVTMPILPIDSTIVSNPSRAHLSISRELEDQVDDSPCDDNELDGPENEEDEDSDPAEPSLGSVGDIHFSQERWSSGNSRDLEQDDGETGIADQDGLDEQVPFRDWPNVGMV